jgi:hypothetical protein
MIKVRGAVVRLSLLVAVGWLGMTGAAWGQDLGGAAQEVASSPSDPRTFGAASEVAHVISAWDMQVIQGNGQSGSTAGERRCDVGGCQFLGGVRLPAGALVSRIELQACDLSASQELHYALWRTGPPAQPNVPLPGTRTILTGAAATGDQPGCKVFTESLTTPETIDNENNTYFVWVQGNVTVNFLGVRIYYTLQVSPAPAVASFGDVPTGHQFFRFIEALKASGITGGCQLAPPLYCPDQAVTRGQMAVFLATALGLHFAP